MHMVLCNASGEFITLHAARKKDQFPHSRLGRNHRLRKAFVYCANNFMIYCAACLWKHKHNIKNALAIIDDVYIYLMRKRQLTIYTRSK